MKNKIKRKQSDQKFKYRYLKAALIIFVIFVLFYSISQLQRKTPESGLARIPLEEMLEKRLEEFANNIVSGGPPKDGIPSIDEPKYVSVSEADKFLEENDVVFVVDYKNNVKIFPQKILVWHEIVNDDVDGEKIAVTYCPLTGSAIGFKGKFNSIETTFGTSGKLVNSNLVMYDRATESYWPQILGVAVTGSQKGRTLEQFPVIWTRWNKARGKYPNAVVLSRDTGFIRSYGRDPYGSYLTTNNYYDSGGAFFPVMAKDNRLEAKRIVVGVKINNSELAIVKSKIAENKIANLFIEEMPIVVIYDESLDTVRVYSRKLENRVLNFEINNGNIVDKETGSEWNVFGKSVNGVMKSKKLEPVNSFDVMWFAWVAFYPQTEIYN